MHGKKMKGIGCILVNDRGELMGASYRISFVLPMGIFLVLLILWAEIALAKNPYTFSYSISHDDQGYSEQIPIEKHLKEVLEKAGFDITGEEKKPSDLALEIEVRGIPVGASYSFGFEERRTLYTGAQVEGTISGMSSKSKVLGKPFLGRIVPPSRIEFTTFSTMPWIGHAGPLEKKDAPFSKAWDIANFWDVLGRIIGKTLGRNAHISYWIGAIQATFPKIGDKATIGLKEIWHKAVPSLLPLFDSPYRERAIETVHQIGKPAVPYLISSLEKVNTPIKTGIVDALGRIQDPKGLPVLTKLLINYLHTEEYDHLATVAKALGDTGQEEAIKPLIDTLRTLNKRSSVPYFYRKPFRDALIKISGQDFGTSSKTWLKWWESKGQS